MLLLFDVLFARRNGFLFFLSLIPLHKPFELGLIVSGHGF